MTSNYDPFDPLVPQEFSDSLAETQLPLMNNFFQLFQAFAQNHVSLDASSGAGNHTIIQLSEIPFTTLPQTGVGEISIYSKFAVDQTDQVFLTYQGDGQEIQLTNYQIYTIDPTQPPLRFFTFLPGRVIVYFGTVLTQGLNSYDFILAPSPATNILALSFCPIKNNATIQFKPWANPIATPGGFTTIRIQSSNGSPMSDYFYILVANI